MTNLHRNGCLFTRKCYAPCTKAVSERVLCSKRAREKPSERLSEEGRSRAHVRTHSCGSVNCGCSGAASSRFRLPASGESARLISVHQAATAGESRGTGAVLRGRCMSGEFAARVV